MYIPVLRKMVWILKQAELVSNGVTATPLFAQTHQIISRMEIYIMRKFGGKIFLSQLLKLLRQWDWFFCIETGPQGLFH